LLATTARVVRIVRTQRYNAVLKTYSFGWMLL
jgi:hypothetical protein